MKKILFVLSLAVFGLMNTVQAQDDAPAVPADGPKISFDKAVHDYGTIENGADGTCEFTFKNDGNKPLVISNAKGSCGCTVPNWPKEPIAPGESGTIKVRYDTKRTGAINKSVTVYSNAVNRKTATLRITGTVKAPVKKETPVKAP